MCDSTVPASAIFRTEAIEVRTEPMLRIQGYTDLSRVRKVILQTAREMAALAERSFLPEVHYLRVPIRSCECGVLTLETETVFTCRAFSKFLTNCHEVVVFILTVGRRFDDELRLLLSDQKVLESLFFECAGWLGVETVTRRFAHYLREEAKRRGERVTRRLSPGYSFRVESDMCEWHLSDQAALFSLFRDTHLPISVLESGAMIPKMSRSGIYGTTRLGI